MRAQLRFPICFLLLASQLGYPQDLARRSPLKKLLPPLRAVEYADEGESVHQSGVVPVDRKRGLYKLVWLGEHGKEQEVLYQRSDAVDVVVEASVEKIGPRYRYTYKVHNLPSSGVFLGGFAVQAFSPAVVPTQQPRINVGKMSSSINLFREGAWYRYGMLDQTYLPATTFIAQLESSSAPGIVRCRVNGGELVLRGSDEEMPPELADSLPGYEEWPYGLTIGPVDDSALPTNERADYLVRNLENFLSLGWMTPSASNWYRAHIKTATSAEILKQARMDMRAKRITSEVFALLSTR